MYPPQVSDEGKGGHSLFKSRVHCWVRPMSAFQMSFVPMTCMCAEQVADWAISVLLLSQQQVSFPRMGGVCSTKKARYKSLLPAAIRFGLYKKYIIHGRCM